MSNPETDPATSTDAAATRHTVLRTRIGVYYPADIALPDVQDRITAAITETIHSLGGSLDVLQIGLAARPDWDEFGPTNRVTHSPLWDPEPRPEKDSPQRSSPHGASSPPPRNPGDSDAGTT